MPTFGPYETAQRLFLSGVGGIYALKTDPKKVIKVLHPPVGIWSDERIQEEIDGFRLRAKIQKGLAKTSRHWAPIHDSAAIRDSVKPGESTGGEQLDSDAGVYESRPVADGAYAVMDRYERSVQSLIDGRIAIQNSDLRALFTGIFQGLLDLRKSGSRPHGALKANNILLANSADLSTATLHLTDPAPDGALTPNSAAKDLSDLGRILYHLVHRRAYDEGTIGRNKEWDALGPNGEDWRKLCNNFLDTHAPAEERDLEKLLPRIQTWTAKPKRSKAPLIAAAVFLILIAGGVGAYLQFRPKPVKFDTLSWQTESLTYYYWFSDFTNEVTKASNRAKYSGMAPRPGEPAYPALSPLFLKDQDFDPISISRKGADLVINWEEVIANPNQFVINPPGPDATQKGLVLIKAVTDAIEKWPVVTKLDDAAKRYQDLGWEKPAGGLHSVSLAVHPPQLPAPAHLDNLNGDIRERFKQVDEAKGQRKSMFESMDRAIVAAKAVDNIDKHWASILKKMDSLHIDTLDLPLLKKLPDFAKALPHSQAKPDDPGKLEDLSDLDASFTKIEALLTTLTTALTTPGDEINFAELKTDALANDAVAPSIAAFESLAATLPRYVKLKSDPRTKVAADWQARLPAVQSDMDDFLTKAAAARVEGIQGKLDQLKTRRDDLKAALDEAAKTPAIAKNADAIAAAAADATGKIQKLFDDAEVWSAPFKTDPVQYVKQKHDYILTATLATPVVDAPWKAAFNKFLAKVEASQENLRKDYNYKLNVDDKFKRLEEAYRYVEARIPANVPALSDVTGTDWRHTIAAHVAKDYRENALKDLVTNLPPPSDDVPNIADPAYVSYQTQRLAAFEKSRTDTLALLKDYTALNDGLDHLDLLPNEPSAGNSWRDLFAKWAGGGGRQPNPLLADTVIVAALKPASDRVAALAALDAVADYASLVALTQSPAAEIVLTAWRKLGSATITEATPVLDDEEKAESTLKARMAALGARLDAARTQKLNAEIAAARPVRWHRWADLAKDGENIARAVTTAKSFGIDINRQSEPALFYYQQLINLRAAFRTNAASEDALKGPAADFMKTLTDPALSDIAKNQAVATLLDEMKKSLSKEQDVSAASKQGPQWADWKMDAPNDQVRIFHSKDGKFTLEFQMMSVSEANSQKTVYLCTTEMSVGLFAEIMNTLGKFSDVDNKNHAKAEHWFEVPANKADDHYLDKGVRSWVITNGKFDVNNVWMDDPGPLMAGVPIYPAGATPAAPDADAPMQLLSPWSAMYAAQLLGCRLPTTAEWKAAYAAFEDKPSLPKDVWNLRGEGGGGARATWRTQQDYTKINELKRLPYPDQGIYLEDPFYKFQGKNAIPGSADALAKIAPNRVTPGATPYQNNTLWFLPIDKEIAPALSANGPKLTMHHLVGNVAEYAFDGDTATAVVTTNVPSTAEIDKLILAGKKKLFEIGGSSLSPPDIAFNKEQAIDPTDSSNNSGFCDIGFRLAYTAPKDTIVQVLERAFKDPRILPGPRSGK